MTGLTTISKFILYVNHLWNLGLTVQNDYEILIILINTISIKLSYYL